MADLALDQRARAGSGPVTPARGLLAALALGLAAGGRPTAGAAPVTTPDDSSYVRVGADRVFYRSAGQGRPLVFVGLGGGVDSRLWEAQAERFAASRRVILVDARGFGRSDTPSGPYSHSADLVGVLTALRVHHAVVVGLSAGGGVAIDAVLRRPDLFDGLVVVGSVLGGYRFSPAFLSREERNGAPAARGDYAAVAANWIADRYTMPSAGERARKWYRALRLAPENLRAYRPGGLRPPDPLEPPAIRRLGEIHARTLVVMGARDHPDVARIAGLLAGGIAGARLVRVPRAGHLVPIEQPEWFDRVVQEFLVPSR